MENSEFVRQHGLEIFMEKQKVKYTCPKCGGIISIHDRECSECQEKIPAVDEKMIEQMRK